MGNFTEILGNPKVLASAAMGGVHGEHRCSASTEPAPIPEAYEHHGLSPGPL